MWSDTFNSLKYFAEVIAIIESAQLECFGYGIFSKELFRMSYPKTGKVFVESFTVCFLEVVGDERWASSYKFSS